MSLLTAKTLRSAPKAAKRPSGRTFSMTFTGTTMGLREPCFTATASDLCHKLRGDRNEEDLICQALGRLHGGNVWIDPGISKSQPHPKETPFKHINERKHAWMTGLIAPAAHAKPDQHFNQKKTPKFQRKSYTATMVKNHRWTQFKLITSSRLNSSSP